MVAGFSSPLDGNILQKASFRIDHGNGGAINLQSLNLGNPGRLVLLQFGRHMGMDTRHAGLRFPDFLKKSLPDRAATRGNSGDGLAGSRKS